MSMQSKLLAAIQNREIFRIGSNRPIPIDIRLISATNKPIIEMVVVNTFREDLLYRINTIQILLPPLRHRIEDIPSLVNHFLIMYGEKYNKQELKVSSQGMDALLKYSFPGNIRELEHMVEKAVILCESGILKQEDLFFQQKKFHVAGKRSFDLELNEKQLILDALEMHGNNYTKASNELNISRKHFIIKLRNMAFNRFFRFVILQAILLAVTGTFFLWTLTQDYLLITKFTLGFIWVLQLYYLFTI